MTDPAKKRLVFLVVAVGVFMSTLDSSMVNIALPVIMQEFGSPLHKTEWVVMIYLLTITVSLLFWGHLSDRLGRRRIYPLGMFIFGAGSLFCGVAPRIDWLILCRFGQALGAAMMMSTGPAIIRETFSTARLGRNLGLVGIAVSLGLMTGPALGGFLIEYYSWRAIFFVTVPLGLIFCGLAALSLPKSAPPASPGEFSKVDFDWFGALAWALALTLTLLTITHATSAAWSTRTLLALLVISILMFYWLWRHEAGIPHPLLPFALFKKRFFAAAILSALLSFTVLFTVILLMPFFLDRVLGLSGSRIGLTMMAIPLAVLIVAPLAGWLSDAIGARYLSSLGLLISTLSVFLLAGLRPDSTPLAIAGRLALLGCGQAMFLSPNSASVLVNVENAYAGVSAGLLATARNLGMLLGIGLASLVFSKYFAMYTGGLDLKDYNPVHRQAFLLALRAAFHTAAALGLCGMAISWLRGPVKTKTG